MKPPRQRLEPDDFLGFEIDLGLIDRVYIARGDRATQLPLDQVAYTFAYRERPTSGDARARIDAL
jgi:hypothetical protein